jgi:hypothetical protein
MPPDAAATDYEVARQARTKVCAALCVGFGFPMTSRLETKQRVDAIDYPREGARRRSSGSAAALGRADFGRLRAQTTPKTDERSVR